MDTDVYGVDNLKGEFDDDIDSKFAKFDLAVKTLADNIAATALKVTNDISTINVYEASKNNVIVKDISTINVYDKSNKVIVETNPFGSNADKWSPALITKDEKIEYRRTNKKKFHVSLK